jgi:hypothetical protein
MPDLPDTFGPRAGLGLRIVGLRFGKIMISG